MFCSKCGTESPEESAFCHDCGALIAVTAIADMIIGPRVAKEAFLAEVKVGEGLYVTLVGGIGIGLAGVLGLFLTVRSASRERARLEV